MPYVSCLRHRLRPLKALLIAASALLLSLGLPAHAATLGTHLATAHFGPQPADRRLESATPGLYLRTDAGFTLGGYRNSYGRQSVYAGWTWETSDRRFALTAGAVSGYSAARVMPLLAPSARVPITHGIALRIALFPKPLKGGHSAGVHLALERGF